MKKQKHIISKIYLAVMMIFFYLPILYTVLFSFNSSKSLSKFSGFSLQWYEKMFNNHDMVNSIYYTISVAIISTLVSTIFGTITAIGLSKSGKTMRAAVSQINDLPIMNPDIVTGIGLLMLFSSLAIPKGYMTMLLSHIMFCTPFVILTIMPRLRALDPNLLDAALDLGCTPFQALTKVIIPQITSGIMAGALIAFTMSFDDFVISYFVTGNGVNNISIMVYTMSKRINPSINALSTVVIAIILVGLILFNIIPIIKEKFERKNKK
ncbi:MAG: ABC transporter permease [Lachnospirales bacterium]